MCVCVAYFGLATQGLANLPPALLAVRLFSYQEQEQSSRSFLRRCIKPGANTYCNTQGTAELGEEVPNLGVQRAGDLAEGSDRRLALTVLNRVDGLG